MLAVPALPLNSVHVESRISDIIGMEQGTPNSTPASLPSVTGGESKPAKGAADVSGTLSSLPIDIGKIADPVVKQAMIVLLNLVERQAREITALREENQRLRDENNRLKGEQGKPDVKPNKTSGNISSEKERRSREPNCRRERGTKLDKITIHRTTVCPVDRKRLPDDAVFKG